ncbi:hypothetical protein ACUXG3_005124 [Bacillus thuringiensis]
MTNKKFNEEFNKMVVELYLSGQPVKIIKQRAWRIRGNRL